MAWACLIFLRARFCYSDNLREERARVALFSRGMRWSCRSRTPCRRAGDASKRDKQRLVGALGLGTCGVDVVVDPKIRAPGVFVLQNVKQLGLAESRLAKCNEQRSQENFGEVFCFHHDSRGCLTRESDARLVESARPFLPACQVSGFSILLTGR